MLLMLRGVVLQVYMKFMSIVQMEFFCMVALGNMKDTYLNLTDRIHTITKFA